MKIYKQIHLSILVTLNFLHAAAENRTLRVKNSTFKLFLSDIIAFTTGMPFEPPLGFSPHPSATFTTTSKYPSANTRENVLCIPTEDASYEDFTWHMCFGILNSAGFGQI